MKVKLKKINGLAKLPKQAKSGDFGYDVYAVSEEEIAPNVWRYGIGFKYEIERGQDLLLNIPYIGGEYNICLSMRPRSSIWRTGMELSNSTGTLDEFFRGEAAAIFYHIFPSMERYHVGDKIGQVFLTVSPVAEFEFVDSIDECTERGEGGFGSTGK